MSVRRRTARSALVLAALLPALLLPGAAVAMPLEPAGTEAALAPMPASPAPVDLRSADAIAAEIEAERAAVAPAAPAVTESPGVDWRLVAIGTGLFLVALAVVTATRVRAVRRRVHVVA